MTSSPHLRWLFEHLPVCEDWQEGKEEDEGEEDEDE